MPTEKVLNKAEIIDLCDVRNGKLVLHSSVPAQHEEWIESHEQSIRDEIAKRYTAAGFIRRLSKIHLLELQAAATISLDLETTALTPYSTGLDVLSDGCIGALRPYGVRRSDLHVVAATADRVYPFGTLSRLRETARVGVHPRANGVRRRRLHGDGG